MRAIISKLLGGGLIGYAVATYIAWKFGDIDLTSLLAFLPEDYASYSGWATAGLGALLYFFGWRDDKKNRERA